MEGYWNAFAVVVDDDNDAAARSRRDAFLDSLIIMMNDVRYVVVWWPGAY